MQQFRKSGLGLLIVCLLFSARAFSQGDRALQKLVSGKKFFWEAKFDNAAAALREVIRINPDNKKLLFEAHLYLGFVLTREEAPNSEVQTEFEQAVRLDPKRKLDETVIPPDLVEGFNATRNRLTGCLYVVSEPSGVNLVCVQGDSILFRDITPVLICELVDNDYQVLLTKEGFEEKFFDLAIMPGRTDTLRVTMPRRYVQVLKKKKIWPWVAVGGGIIASTAIIFSVSGGGNEPGGGKPTPLPGPPVRPPEPR